MKNSGISMRIINKLRKRFPDGDWKWDREHQVWGDERWARYVRAESVQMGCCMSGDCDHYRTRYRIHEEFYGPRKIEYAWSPQYDEVIFGLDFLGLK